MYAYEARRKFQTMALPFYRSPEPRPPKQANMTAICSRSIVLSDSRKIVSCFPLKNSKTPLCPSLIRWRRLLLLMSPWPWATLGQSRSEPWRCILLHARRNFHLCVLVCLYLLKYLSATTSSAEIPRGKLNHGKMDIWRGGFRARDP